MGDVSELFPQHAVLLEPIVDGSGLGSAEPADHVAPRPDLSLAVKYGAWPGGAAPSLARFPLPRRLFTAPSRSG